MSENLVAEVPVSVPAPPAKVVFGWKGFSLPTPEICSKVFNFILGVCIVVPIILHAYPSIPHSFTDKADEIALGTIGAARAICKAFGIKIQDVDTTNLK